MEFPPGLMDKINFMIFVFFIPFFFSFLLIVTWMKFVTRKDKDIQKMHGKYEFLKFIFTFHTDKGLMQQGLLWLCLITPLVYFFCLGSMAWQGHELRLDAEGFNNFISLSKLPLAILSLSIPLSVLVARFHTSRQTAEQIKITRQKNNVDLFHSHRKELFTYFQQVGAYEFHQNLVVKNIVHPRLHKIYFKGKVQDGVPVYNDEKFREIEHLLSSTRNHLISVLKDINPDLTYSFYLTCFCRNIYELSQTLGIPEISELMSKNPGVPCRIDSDDLHLETVGVSTDEAIAAFICAENFFHNLCDFANYESPYIKNDSDRKEFLKIRREISKTPNKDRVIESLHENEIKDAFQLEWNKKWYPKSFPS